MVADFYGVIQVLRNADGGGGCISGKLFKLLNLRSPWGGCISGKLFKLLNLRSPRDCGSYRPLYSNHAIDRPATCAHSSEVASMVADFYVSHTCHISNIIYRVYVDSHSLGQLASASKRAASTTKP